MIVGWDPALGTFYAQIYDSDPDDVLFVLPPEPSGIQDVDTLEAYINEVVKDELPPVKFNKVLRLNLERDKLAEGGYHNNIEAKKDLGVMPPSVSSSGIVFSYREGDIAEYCIEDIKDWFFDNYKDALQHSNEDTQNEATLYRVRDEVLKYWAGEYPDAILNAAIKAIEDTGTLNWVAASWRFDVLEHS